MKMAGVGLRDCSRVAPYFQSNPISPRGEPDSGPGHDLAYPESRYEIRRLRHGRPATVALRGPVVQALPPEEAGRQNPFSRRDGSLNNDKAHYITNVGTGFAVMAPAACR